MPPIPKQPEWFLRDFNLIVQVVRMIKANEPIRQLPGVPKKSVRAIIEHLGGETYIKLFWNVNEHGQLTFSTYPDRKHFVHRGWQARDLNRMQELEDDR